MKRIINGKTYNTETALEIADVGSSGLSRSDFRWNDTFLYKSLKGQFFLAGEGGAMSRWAQSYGNMTGSGEGIELIDKEEARTLAEHHGCSDEIYIQAFGQPEEG